MSMWGIAPAPAAHAEPAGNGLARVRLMSAPKAARAGAHVVGPGMVSPHSDSPVDHDVVAGEALMSIFIPAGTRLGRGAPVTWARSPALRRSGPSRSCLGRPRPRSAHPRLRPGNA